MQREFPAGALTTLVVSAETQAALDGVLATLLREGGAIAAMVVEQSGLPLARAGEGRAASDGVGALAAGIFKSLKTLSGLVGENAVRSLWQRGPHSCTALTLLDTDDLLVAQFPVEVPESRSAGPLGAAANEVARLLAGARQNQAARPLSLDASAIDDVLGSF